MDLVNMWLKGIVLIILFATFMDLLLPNSSMQKYVKLVIGLIIIVTMLTPLLYILHGGDAVPGLDFLNFERGEAIVASAITDVHTQMDSSNQEMIISTVKQMTEQEVINIIQSQGVYQYVRMEIDLTNGQSQEQMDIAKIDIYLKQLVDEPVDGSEGLVTPVEQIRPIEIGAIEIGRNDMEAEQQLSGIDLNHPDSQRLKQLVSDKLTLSADKINLYISEEG